MLALKTCAAVWQVVGEGERGGDLILNPSREWGVVRHNRQLGEFSRKLAEYGNKPHK